MGIRKASYNRTLKSSFNSPKENIKRLSGKNIYPSTCTKEKLGTSMRRQNKKDLPIHAQRNEGCSLHPGQFVLYMYV